MDPANIQCGLHVLEKFLVPDIESGIDNVGMLLSRTGVEQAVRRALAIFGRELEMELGPDEYAAALEHGRGLQLAEVVAEIVGALNEGS